MIRDTYLEETCSELLTKRLKNNKLFVNFTSGIPAHKFYTKGKSGELFGSESTKSNRLSLYKE